VTRVTSRMSETAEHRHVLLIGLPGAGKTSVGRRLAKDLQRPFADVDEQLELQVGRCIPQIFAEDGEDAFRRWETEVFADLMGRPHPLVVAAGGGTVMREANQAVARKHGFVVWLRASPRFLASRTDPTHRPLLADDPEAAFERLVGERSRVYADVADVTVDVEPFHSDVAEAKPKNAIAAHIVSLFPGASR
jgi:shikimate kinase